MRRLVTAATVIAFGCTAALAETDPADVQHGEMGAIAASLSGSEGNAESGKTIMVTRGKGNCIACHQVSALEEFPFHGEVGPSLDGVGDRWSETELRGIVANAKMLFDGTIMPAFYKTSGFIRPGDAFTGKAAAESDLETLLTAQEIEDVVAYLATLKE